MRKIYCILLFFAVAILFSTCTKKPELKMYDLELSDEIVVADVNSVTITAKYTYPGEIDEVWVLISTDYEMTNPIESVAQLDENTIRATIGNLSGDTRYYYRFKYSNGVGLVETDIKDFTTEHALIVPTVSTASVSSITTNSAISGGNVINDGGTAIVARGVCWSMAQNPTIEDAHTEDGTGTGGFVSNITGLEAFSVYYVRAYATNGEGTGYGNEMMFVTEKTIPTIITADVTDINLYSAVCGGDVTVLGGSTLVAGVCWSITENPTVEDEHTEDATGLGVFSSNLSGLSMNTTYYVRAYATNELGTAYGEQKSFKTLFYIPGEIIHGKYTINEYGSKVYFSNGNLQYQATTNTWRIATHQWDYLGDENSNISSTYSGFIDLFGWGTGNNPTNSSTNNDDYAVFTDWGNYCSNDINYPWRTLTKDEWSYIFTGRTTSSNIRFAKANVNGINGVILLPDDWNSNIYWLSNTNAVGADFSGNIISASDWTATLEANGAVFLPAAGWRVGTTISGAGFIGHYWSQSVPSNGVYAYIVYFYDSNLYTENNGNRSRGFSVRLVCSTED